jgi:hypothetical protein
MKNGENCDQKNFKIKFAHPPSWHCRKWHRQWRWQRNFCLQNKNKCSELCEMARKFWGSNLWLAEEKNKIDNNNSYLSLPYRLSLGWAKADQKWSYWGRIFGPRAEYTPVVELGCNNWRMSPTDQIFNKYLWLDAIIYRAISLKRKISQVWPCSTQLFGS